MKNPILCSTGAFIHGYNDYDHTLIEKINRDTNFNGFEIFMFDGFHLANRLEEYKEFAKTVTAAKDNGILFNSMHMFKQIGEMISRNEPGDIERAVYLFEHNCEYAAKYGAKLLVLHLWGGVPSDKNIGVNIGLYPKLKKISDNYNLTLTVENIVCNTHRPLDHMKKLWELYPDDIEFTIDIRQAEFHKSLIETCESSFLWDNGLVSNLHISDYCGGKMEWERLRVSTPINCGDVDFDYLFSFLKSVNYSGPIVVETAYDKTIPYDEMIADLNRSHEFIENNPAD